MPSQWFYYTEPILKILLPLINVSFELYLDHPDGFQYLRCPEGKVHPGRFAHVNNWQHACTYPPIVLSGLIDLLSTQVPLPQGTAHVFLAVAFLVQAFIMGTHKKQQPQDATVHRLLFSSMLLCFLFIVLELNALKNPLPALGRGAAAIFLGAWLCHIGKIEFENLPEWSEEYSGGTMMAPVYFVTFAMIVLCAVTVLGLLMAAMSRFNIVLRVLLFHDDDAHGGHQTRYLELARHDTAPQHAQQHNESSKLLSLSIKRNSHAFETDSAQQNSASASPSSSSVAAAGGESSSPRTTSFAFPSHPQDLV
jgi:hypothetical protein